MAGLDHQSAHGRHGIRGRGGHLRHPRRIGPDHQLHADRPGRHPRAGPRECARTRGPGARVDRGGARPDRLDRHAGGDRHDRLLGDRRTVERRLRVRRDPRTRCRMGPRRRGPQRRACPAGHADQCLTPTPPAGECGTRSLGRRVASRADRRRIGADAHQHRAPLDGLCAVPVRGRLDRAHRHRRLRRARRGAARGAAAGPRHVRVRRRDADRPPSGHAPPRRRGASRRAGGHR